MKRSIIIAGGGLAGLSLGVALRRAGVPVTIHEAGKYPRHRVCGEYISGVSDQTLERLGILDLFEPARMQRSTSWFFQERLVAQHSLPEAARGISRHYLDDTLAERFEELGGELRTGSRLAQDGREGVVWSAGRRPSRGEWIGLKCHVRDCPTNSDLEMHLGRHAYVGLAGVEGGATNVCGLFRVQPGLAGPNVLRSYLEKSGLGALAERIWSAEVDEDSQTAIAGFRLGWQPWEEGTIALGDSLAMIPPFTGNGMSMAFQSAETALTPLVAYSEGRSTWRETAFAVRKRLHRRFWRRLLLARLLHPFLTSGRGQSVLASAASRDVLPFRLCYHLLR